MNEHFTEPEIILYFSNLWIPAARHVHSDVNLKKCENEDKWRV